MVRGKRGDARAGSPEASGRPEGRTLGPVIGRHQRAAGSEEQHERPIEVSDLDFVFIFARPSNSADFNIFPRLPGCRASTKSAARLAPNKALKARAFATPHTAPQPPPGVDIEAEDEKLHEAVARGAQEAQLARALESGGDAGQNGIVMAAQADAEEEAGRGCADDTA